MKGDFKTCLVNKAGFKGFGIAEDKLTATSPFIYEGKEYTLKHGMLIVDWISMRYFNWVLIMYLGCLKVT